MIGNDLAGEPDLSRWLEAAAARRREARAALARAARACPAVARRYEREAEIHMASAVCHEFAAQASFEVALVTEDAARARFLREDATPEQSLVQ